MNGGAAIDFAAIGATLNPSHEQRELALPPRGSGVHLIGFDLGGGREGDVRRNKIMVHLLLSLIAGISCDAHARADWISSTQVITSPTIDERTGQGLVTIDVTGIPSMDRSRSPNNIVMYVWVGPFNVVNGGGFDVWLQTVVPTSSLSDLVVSVTNSAGLPGPAFGFSPGVLDTFPGGTFHYSRPVSDLSPDLPTVTALSDGLIRLEFFERFDEAPGAADGLWVSGTITLQTQFPIPTPVSPGVASLLALAAGHVSRRQREARRR
ncbi:MAG: hypothetical protein JNK58_11675 [Phycisphaerae bacterium]|nr:hypothetical protein [Phycisphaerae bacterium]